MQGYEGLARLGGLDMEIRRLFYVCVVAGAIGGGGCAGRNPVPADMISLVQPHEMPGVRVWESQYTASLDANSLDSCDCSFLALSGGGPNGAFGAGILSGWTEAGTRPKFAVVTGISTGALIAPFAFAGAEYDNQLEWMYTDIGQSDIFFFSMMVDAIFDTTPLVRQLEMAVDDKLLARIAEEHARGRRLYIGTTDLDTKRLMVWDMGAIASSKHPRTALALFRQVMLASASMPVAFKPQYFDVEAGTKKYEEMHVDGGVVTPVFGYGRDLFQNWPVAGQLRSRQCSLYLIRNGSLGIKMQPVPRKMLDIGVQSLETLIDAQTTSAVYLLHDTAVRDGVKFNYAYIPDVNDGEPGGALGMVEFDKKKMRELFEKGRKMVMSGECWKKELPGKK
jgi:predicted acylesterase/phospholipase RssA